MPSRNRQLNKYRKFFGPSANFLYTISAVTGSWHNTQQPVVKTKHHPNETLPKRNTTTQTKPLNYYCNKLKEQWTKAY